MKCKLNNFLLHFYWLYCVNKLCAALSLRNVCHILGNVFTGKPPATNRGRTSIIIGDQVLKSIEYRISKFTTLSSRKLVQILKKTCHDLKYELFPLFLTDTLFLFLITQLRYTKHLSVGEPQWSRFFRFDRQIIRNIASRVSTPPNEVDTSMGNHVSATARIHF